MKEKIKLIDSLLANITAKGDELMYLAIARQELKKIFDELKEEN